VVGVVVVEGVVVLAVVVTSSGWETGVVEDIVVSGLGGGGDEW